MRQTRYILLVSFLLVAIATQRAFVSYAPAARIAPLPDISLTDLARQIARRIARPKQKPQPGVLAHAVRVSRRRLHLLVQRLLSASFFPPPLSPFLFRLPPPAGC